MRKLRLFIIVAVTAALLLPVLSGCKKHQNDITGVWFFLLTFPDGDVEEYYDFVGNDSSGQVYWEGQALGTYSVFGDNVSFTLEYIDGDGDYTVEVYNGTILHDDEMNGSVTITWEGLGSQTGTWYAER